MSDHETQASETLDAIRMAVDAAADDKSAIAIVKALLDDGPPEDASGTGSVRRLVEAVQRTNSRFVIGDGA